MGRTLPDPIPGSKYGRLTIIEETPVDGRRGRKVRVKCDCGSDAKVVQWWAVLSGKIVGCGCVNRERSADRLHRLQIQQFVKKPFSKHGMIGTRTYASWQAMKTRCLNPTDAHRSCYIDRGIRVCVRWLEFENFLADMGERPPGKTLDRIDNDKGYHPGNCRWATPSEQARNRRRHVNLRLPVYF